MSFAVTKGHVEITVHNVRSSLAFRDMLRGARNFPTNSQAEGPSDYSFFVSGRLTTSRAVPCRCVRSKKACKIIILSFSCAFKSGIARVNERHSLNWQGWRITTAGFTYFPNAFEFAFLVCFWWSFITHTNQFNFFNVFHILLQSCTNKLALKLWRRVSWLLLRDT